MTCDDTYEGRDDWDEMSSRHRMQQLEAMRTSVHVNVWEQYVPSSSSSDTVSTQT